MSEELAAPWKVSTPGDLVRPAQVLLQRLSERAERATFQGSLEEVGVVEETGDGVARVTTIPGTRFGELLLFTKGVLGMVFDLGRRHTGCVLLGDTEVIHAGDLVRRTGEVVRVPVSPELIGRVVDPLGNPLDGGDSIETEELLPVEQPAPPITHRRSVSRPLQTGIKSVDSMIPIGRGQRELIVGDRSTGKTALAIDTIINQRDGGVICIYTGIGQRTSATAAVIAALRRHRALDYSLAVIADADDPPGLIFIAPYAATTIAEYFCRQGRDVLVVYDDLTKHAQTYRQISLLLRQPPGREAYPGDIFYIHSRLLERATQLAPDLGGGSITAIPIVETQAGNISAYIPTNLISITDGQIYLSADLFHHGYKPAVDVGKSVSRVGGQAQQPAMRAIAGPLRLGYTQFEELEIFTRFGARVDEPTRQRIERGRRIRQVLNQPRFQPLPLSHQVIVLLAVSEGLADNVPLQDIPKMEHLLRKEVPETLPTVVKKIETGGEPSEEERSQLLQTIHQIIQRNFKTDEEHQRTAEQPTPSEQKSPSPREGKVRD